ncbi:MAG: TonB-dependent receptor [Henriciella sp.]|uniref:TonB-dependent receptor n=1 Tax=Henriciella sp. TaxID=1968823 RepID=UPI0032ED69C7
MNRSVFLLGAAVLALAPAAMAQDPAADTAERQEDTARLGTVVITAQKREQSLQDVGISVTAYSGEQLDDANLSDSNDLARLVPGLNIGLPTGAGNQPAIFLRGIGLNDFATNNLGPIGVYVDDLFISSPGAQVMQVFDLERVEVLKGPQGTLYGRNTTGGAIKFITARPTETLETGLTAQFAEFGTTKLEGYLSGPLSKAIRGRVAFQKNDSDGYINNAFDGSDAAGTDNLSFRALADVDFASDISGEFGLYGSVVDQPGPRYRSQGVLSPLDATTPCGTGAILANECVNAVGFRNPDGFYTVDQNTPASLEADNFAAQAKLIWNIGEVSITSITGYQSLDKTFLEDSDSSPANILTVQYGVESEDISQEIQIAGGSDRLNWILGGFYSSSSLDQDQRLDLYKEFRPLIESVDPQAYPGGFDPDGAAIGVPALDYRTVNKQDTTIYAAFGQLDYQFAEKWRGTVGLRHTTEDRDFTQEASLVEAGLGVFPLFEFADQQTDEEISWKLGLDYLPYENGLIYASVANGFKGGGYNGGFLFDASEQKPYDPETVTAYELGLKTDLADGIARLNAAVFYNDYSDMQIFTVVSGGGPVAFQVLDNAANAVTQGAEVEVTALPARGLNVSLGLAYLDTELKDYRSDSGLDLSGNSLVQAPEWSANGMLRYERPVSANLLSSVQIDFSYQDKVYFTSDNSEPLSQDAYWLWNAQVGVESQSGRWHAAVFARNLGGEEYYSHGFNLADTIGANQLMLGSPSQIGLEFGVRY